MPLILLLYEGICSSTNKTPPNRVNITYELCLSTELYPKAESAAFGTDQGTVAILTATLTSKLDAKKMKRYQFLFCFVY